ncbi:RHS repeat-associated core domain-containing protein [candidate division CSSED10-310 bacterium]|uniref:RHS repeat-associated core domain-containing protein n=1 Tax=candidate division CSSED10-310 bacterium TaxID=2855610 RepID=A0ABV6YYC8_UNCC1
MKSNSRTGTVSQCMIQYVLTIILVTSILFVTQLWAGHTVISYEKKELTQVRSAIPKPLSSPRFLDTAPLMTSAEGQAVLETRVERISTRLNSRSGEIVITPEISQLSRGLKFDPQLIYEFVRNKIKYIPMYGFHRGVTMTLLDRRGNDFEQTALLIALMREAGYSASFIYGSINLTPIQIDSWLGVGTDPDVLELYLGGGGLLGTVNRSGQTLLSVDLDHVWAKVNIGGTDYVFDPSFKSHTMKSGINLNTAMGYDKSTFLSNAGSGMISTTDYVQNVNRTNIRTDLATFASNLVSYIRTTVPGATMDDIIGGRQIVPETGQAFQTSLPYETVRTYEWNEVPIQYQALITVEHLGINETFSTADVYGRRLDIMYVFSTNLYPYLYLEGETIATGAEVTQTPNQITLSVDHPYSAYGGTFCDESTSAYISVGGLHTVAMMWGGAGRDSIEQHRQKMKEYLAQGNPINTEVSLGEGLMELGFFYLSEITRAAELGDLLAGTATIYHHELGLVGQAAAPYTHVVSKISIVSLDESNSNRLARAYALTGINSAFEWGCIDQSQPYSAVSTIKLFDLANQLSLKIFDATDTNYYASVKDQLQNYSTAELDMFDDFIDAGYRLFIPEQGDLQDNEWQGSAYIWVSPSGDYMGNMIGRGLAGGSGNEDAWLDAEATGSAMPDLDHPEMNPNSSEPIDLVTGFYSTATLDLSVGYGDPPFGLAFFRTYSSGAHLNRGFFGYGWSHNWEANVGETSDGLRGMGDGSPGEAAAAIAEIFISTDILRDGLLTDRLMFATLAHRWLLDNLIDNVVTLKSLGATLQFMQLPDGSYVPPRGEQAQLTKEGDSSYLLTTKQGNQADFDLDGKLISWQDAQGNVVNLAYSSNVLTSISNNFGKSISISYNGDGFINTVTDHTGRSVSYIYDADDLLVSILDPLAAQAKYEYDTEGRLTKVYRPTDLVSPLVTNTYDPFDRVISQDDAETNTYTYHYALVRTEEVDPEGNSRIFNYDDQGQTIGTEDALGKKTAYEYDGLKRLITMTMPEGNGLEYSYDGSTDSISNISIFPKTGSVQSPRVTNFTYDPTTGKVASVTDALGRTVSYTYDGSGNVTRIEYPIVDSQIPTTNLTYNARGQVTQVEDPIGMIKNRTYDPSTAEASSITYDQSGLNISTNTTYDSVGNITGFTDARGNTYTYELNDNRQVTKVTYPAPLQFEARNIFDQNRDLSRIDRQTDDGSHPWHQTSFTTTTFGKPGSFTDDEGRSKSFVYNTIRKIWKIIDNAGNVSEYLYDERGLAHQSIDPLGNINETYSYSDNGLATLLTDARGNSTSYVYDDFDRLSKQVFSDSSFQEFSYDLVSNVTQQITRTGQTISYQYDDLNRMVQKTYPGPITIQFEYDLGSRLTSATNHTGSVEFTYDNLGRMLTETHPGGKIINHEYDANGNRTRITYPDGYYLTYTYDVLDRLTHIYENGATLIAQYTYDALSRLVSLSYQNGTSVNYVYDYAGYLTSQVFNFSNETVSFTYTYDTTSRLSSVTTSDGSFDYVLSSETDTSYTSNNLNQYDMVGGVGYSYDLNGNLTSDGTNTFIYDATNKLMSVTTATQSVSFEYNALGQRASKTVDGTTTSYVYDGSNLIAEYNQSGSMIRRYIYGSTVDCPLLMKTAGGDYYFFQNRHGSVIALSDVLGERTETFSYSPYGKPNQSSTLGNPYLFNGKIYDAETGLYYFRARYYTPEIGRFLSADPIGPAGGSFNLYVYCNNDPVNTIDPTGMDMENYSTGFWGYAQPVEYGQENVLLSEAEKYESLAQQSTGYEAYRYQRIADELREISDQYEAFGIDQESKYGMKLGNIFDWNAPIVPHGVPMCHHSTQNFRKFWNENADPEFKDLQFVELKQIGIVKNRKTDNYEHFGCSVKFKGSDSVIAVLDPIATGLGGIFSFPGQNTVQVWGNASIYTYDQWTLRNYRTNEYKWMGWPDWYIPTTGFTSD